MKLLIFLFDRALQTIILFNTFESGLQRLGKRSVSPVDDADFSRLWTLSTMSRLHAHHQFCRDDLDRQGDESPGCQEAIHSERRPRVYCIGALGLMPSEIIALDVVRSAALRVVGNRVQTGVKSAVVLDDGTYEHFAPHLWSLIVELVEGIRSDRLGSFNFLNPGVPLACDDEILLVSLLRSLRTDTPSKSCSLAAEFTHADKFEALLSAAKRVTERMIALEQSLPQLAENITNEGDHVRRLH